MCSTNLKYANTEVVFQEFPDEVTLAINITGCPNRCKGCHSQYLWEDNGEDLTEDVIDQLILANSGITCIGFMGGDQAPQKVVKLSQYVKSKYPTLHTGWYSGKESFPLYHGTFDYIKLGPWKEECGPLNDPKTNQRMYMNIGGSELNASFADITERAFWAPKPWDADYFDYMEKKKKEENNS